MNQLIEIEAKQILSGIYISFINKALNQWNQKKKKGVRASVTQCFSTRNGCLFGRCIIIMQVAGVAEYLSNQT